MDRRDFLKGLAGLGLGTTAVAVGATDAKATPLPKGLSDVTFMRPASLFEPVLFGPGSATDFPLNILGFGEGQWKTTASRVLNSMDGMVVEGGEGEPWVHVPTFSVCASGKTPPECRADYWKKLNELAGDFLLNCGLGKSYLDSREAAVKWATSCFPEGKRKMVFSEHKGTVIGFNAFCRCSLVMPVRCEFEAFPDPTTGGFFGWADIGLAVLDTSVLTFAVINGSRRNKK